MSARSISRLARTGFAAGALTVALSVPALAVPARDSSGVPVANASGNVTAGTDVAAPDQQNPVPAPTKPIIAPAPTWPENPVALAQPQNVSASPSGDFQWDDAGIGAGGAVLIALTAIGGALIVRRRQTPDAPLAA